MGNTEEEKEAHEKKDGFSFGTVLLSVLLVVLAIGFVFGFKYFLSGRIYSGLTIAEFAGKDPQGETREKSDLEKDSAFQYQYIMLQSLEGRKLSFSEKPGEKADPGVRAVEGQIFKVDYRGYADGQLYYLLDNGLYLMDDKAILPLKEYVALDGYLTITYISSSGVPLHKWADFDADNIVSAVYVGDKVDVSAKVLTLKDIPAFVTPDGYYITTDSRYLNDHTVVDNSSFTLENIWSDQDDPAEEKDAEDSTDD